MHDLQPTNDGGYIASITSYSNDGDFSPSKGVSDAWIVKMDGSGNVEWKKGFGGSQEEGNVTVQQTVDGGYIFAAFTNSNDMDVSGNSAGPGTWVVKLNASGDIVWQKCIGGKYGRPSSIVQVADGYVIGGTLENYSQNRERDVYIFKVDNAGNVIWYKVYGGSGVDMLSQLRLASDGGFIVVGGTNSSDGDVVGNTLGDRLIWVLKLDGNGDLNWQRGFEGELQTISDYKGVDVRLTQYGGYVIVGHKFTNTTFSDYWVIKLNASGNIVWDRTYDGNYPTRTSEYGRAIYPTSDGGYIVAGTS